MNYSRFLPQVDALKGDARQKLLTLCELAVQDYGPIETAIQVA
jgi:hypothetical protein